MVRPPSRAPSEISSTVVGGVDPSLARCLRPLLAASSTASPIAVPSVGFSAPIAARTSERSVVGASASCARDENETTPTRNFFGTMSTSRFAAFCAAARRLGLMSVAPIDRDVSIASITVASSRFTLTVACGRATPMISAASAASRSTSGT